MEKGLVLINNQTFDVLLAISNAEQTQGLMYIEPPAPNMAFVYGEPRINKFWMRDTKIPLDIVFCANDKIISICKGIPYSTSIIGEDNPSDLVIELQAGTCKDYNIKIGDIVRSQFPQTALMQILLSKTGFQL